MSARRKVLLTDYAWTDLEIERSILEQVDADLVVPIGTSESDLVAAASASGNRGVDAIMTCWAKVTPKVIDAAPHCQIVSRLGIGLDNIDIAHCTRRGIPVTNVPDYCVHEVAEHALALVLSLARHVARFHWETKHGRYDLRSVPTPRRLNGQTLGIVGWGRIGKKLAHLARGVGLRVCATSRSSNNDPDVEFMSLPQLLASSDFVSLHLPLTPETSSIINAERLRLMKSSAYLINTSRGGLVDHGDLANALRESTIAGAALDVQTPEPPDLSQPPYNDPRVIVTPHSAFTSVESLIELRTRVANQVACRLEGGTPENIVNRLG